MASMGIQISIKHASSYVVKVVRRFDNPLVVHFPQQKVISIITSVHTQLTIVLFHVVLAVSEKPFEYPDNSMPQHSSLLCQISLHNAEMCRLK